MESNRYLGETPVPAKRPCCVRMLEALHIGAFSFGIWITPTGHVTEALPWLAVPLLAALAISRLRLALVWLLFSAFCIGFLFFVPVGAAFYLPRFEGDTMAVVRMVYALVVAGFTLFLLWSRKTTTWLRAGGGKLSMLVI